MNTLILLSDIWLMAKNIIALAENDINESFNKLKLKTEICVKRLENSTPNKNKTM